MRELADAVRVRRFMTALGEKALEKVRIYFAGGATAVLYGWRQSTIDIDLKIVPEATSVFNAIPAIKEALRVNVELPSRADFIPELAGWEERSPFITREGNASFHHYDLYAQALAKIERGHHQDIQDACAMVERGLIQMPELLARLEEIEPRLNRYPAIDPPTFRRAVESFVGGLSV